MGRIIVVDEQGRPIGVVYFELPDPVHHVSKAGNSDISADPCGG